MKYNNFGFSSLGLKILAGIIIRIFVLFRIFRMLKFKKVSNEITKEYNWKTDKEKFKTEFIQLMTEKPNLNYLVIDFEKYYIQYMGWKNSNEFYCETISNKFLEGSNQLNDLKIKKFIDLNFSEPNTKDPDGNSSPNYSKFYKSGKETEREKIFEIKSDAILKIRYE